MSETLLGGEYAHDSFEAVSDCSSVSTNDDGTDPSQPDRSTSEVADSTDVSESMFLIWSFPPP
ncbi:hypothetical protein PGT21_018226 [Puccinia graminis f. sp. tritici]|uniref:Uncharacterized protein n=1 Tax=Puccinia graminis f. sp. tritici TaxID=56615 RepID=A0A5B0LKU4_PUCGR|nr:hypothetical protein PGT21_018226 [Puccinia graminis f. sp. tritici]KAA1068333.1 hypothetical protein PGTUg99_034358 [Puccinia graminis f. sp. tritici]